MADKVAKWSSGSSYGPVLSQTDLYLLNPTLEIHPILCGRSPKFQLVFNLSNGHSGGFNPDQRDADLPFNAKDEPATLPRVQQLYIITDITPWCTTVKNDRGVTMNDICQAMWRDYSEHNVTDTEFGTLPPRLQEQVKRASSSRGAQNAHWNMYYSPGQAATRFRRFDWLRDRYYFESLRRDDAYAESRLGFKAPNIFVMSLTA
ncbi:hypothetical protein DFS33DRAFT_262250 [Desarmillaria ectypa]|nr:hypothetical protein DFS33DRAFT_262250 [Desarmillaria ectypa]